MILCHKCGGLLTEASTGLYGCGCISGYIRGFEPHLTRAQAIAEQVKETKERISMFIRQGRSESEIGFYRKRLAALENLVP